MNASSANAPPTLPSTGTCTHTCLQLRLTLFLPPLFQPVDRTIARAIPRATRRPCRPTDVRGCQGKLAPRGAQRRSPGPLARAIGAGGARAAAAISSQLHGHSHCADVRVQAAAAVRPPTVLEVGARCGRVLVPRMGWLHQRLSAGARRQCGAPSTPTRHQGNVHCRLALRRFLAHGSVLVFCRALLWWRHQLRGVRPVANTP